MTCARSASDLRAHGQKYNTFVYQVRGLFILKTFPDVLSMEVKL